MAGNGKWRVKKRSGWTEIAFKKSKMMVRSSWKGRKEREENKMLQTLAEDAKKIKQDQRHYQQELKRIDNRKWNTEGGKYKNKKQNAGKEIGIERLGKHHIKNNKGWKY